MTFPTSQRPQSACAQVAMWLVYSHSNDVTAFRDQPRRPRWPRDQQPLPSWRSRPSRSSWRSTQFQPSRTASTNELHFLGSGEMIYDLRVGDPSIQDLLPGCSDVEVQQIADTLCSWASWWRLRGCAQLWRDHRPRKLSAESLLPQRRLFREARAYLRYHATRRVASSMRAAQQTTLSLIEIL